MGNIKICVFFVLFLLNSVLYAERVRVLVKDRIEVNSDIPAGVSISLAYNDSVLIFLQQDVRFIRGVELEFTAPQTWLPHQGSLAFGLYSNLDSEPVTNPAEIECTPVLVGPIPNKIQTVYQIPLHTQHGLRGTPYMTLLKAPVPPESFPLLFRLTPTAKGWSREIESMRFQLNVKPVFSDEGALSISVHRPEFPPNGSYTVLIDDQVVENSDVETLVKEGEHTLTLLSPDYRTENRRFVIERGKTLSLSVTLQDLTPLVIFEAPALARIFIDNTPVMRTNAPLAVDPGIHDVRIQLSDYTIIKTVTIEKGKTYRVAFIVDMQVSGE
ncbi:MAG: PEGA domain-containing protein [Spirochaetaceae bacterium]|jgi:hypothetical protein|nr:PEGA domain-containing protein [Spirochaetaceae bacterium]